MILHDKMPEYSFRKSNEIQNNTVTEHFTHFVYWMVFIQILKKNTKIVDILYNCKEHTSWQSLGYLEQLLVFDASKTP